MRLHFKCNSIQNLVEKDDDNEDDDDDDDGIDETYVTFDRIDN